MWAMNSNYSQFPVTGLNFMAQFFRGGAKLGMVFAAGATRSWHRSTRRGLAMQGF